MWTSYNGGTGSVIISDDATISVSGNPSHDEFVAGCVLNRDENGVYFDYAPQSYNYNQNSTGDPLSIPCADPEQNGVISTIAISGTIGQISNIEITLTTSGQIIPSGLYAYLIAPDGTKTLLFYNIGETSNICPANLSTDPCAFVSTTFNDAAATSIVDSTTPRTGAFRPFPGSLSIFNGRLADGDWKLQIIQNVGTCVEYLYGWSINVTTSESYYQFFSQLSYQLSFGVNLTSTSVAQILYHYMMILKPTLH